MKRRTMHLLFGTSALVCLTMTAYHGWELNQANRLKQTLERYQTAEQIGQLPEAPTSPGAAALAQANALSRLGDPDAAARAFNRILQQDPHGQAGIAARFNLGNLYLRQAVNSGSIAGPGSEPNIELAKQRYRDLLKLMPQDWDTRYNLEYALRLAPETEATDAGEKDIKERRRVRLPGMSSVQLP